MVTFTLALGSDNSNKELVKDNDKVFFYCKSQDGLTCQYSPQGVVVPAIAIEDGALKCYGGEIPHCEWSW